ncbi:MAG TPA: hypothetical protein PLC06_06670, partial [Promineifilum sp.]|nr:hypothetical protein [Promineifilum sp.]
MKHYVVTDWVETAQLWARRHALPIFFIALTIGLTLILSFDLPGSNQVIAIVGQPAQNDIFSPRSMTYTSDLLTNQAREQAGRIVNEVFTPLDLAIGRSQLTLAREVFTFIEAVRADSSATIGRKLEYLTAIEGLTISEAGGQSLLDLSQPDFDEVRANVFAIIEDLMRQEIRPAQISDFQRTARRLVSLELSTAQTSVVAELAPQFIIPTVFPDEEATASARSEAAAAVPPVSRTVARDQRIIRAGEIVTDTDYELLGELGLLQQSTNWLHALSMGLISLGI